MSNLISKIATAIQFVDLVFHSLTFSHKNMKVWVEKLWSVWHKLIVKNPPDQFNQSYVFLHEIILLSQKRYTFKLSKISLLFLWNFTFLQYVYPSSSISSLILKVKGLKFWIKTSQINVKKNLATRFWIFV